VPYIGWDEAYTSVNSSARPTGLTSLTRGDKVRHQEIGAACRFTSRCTAITCEQALLVRSGSWPVTEPPGPQPGRCPAHGPSTNLG